MTDRLAAIEEVLRRIERKLDAVHSDVREHEITIGTLVMMARAADEAGGGEPIDMPPEIESLLSGRKP